MNTKGWEQRKRVCVTRMLALVEKAACVHAVETEMYQQQNPQNLINLLQIVTEQQQKQTRKQTKKHSCTVLTAAGRRLNRKLHISTEIQAIWQLILITLFHVLYVDWRHCLTDRLPVEALVHLV